MTVHPPTSNPPPSKWSTSTNATVHCPPPTEGVPASNGVTPSAVPGPGLAPFHLLPSRPGHTLRARNPRRHLPPLLDPGRRRAGAAGRRPLAGRRAFAAGRLVRSRRDMTPSPLVSALQLGSKPSEMSGRASVTARARIISAGQGDHASGGRCRVTWLLPGTLGP
jgi:hypothetical protein